MVPRLDAFNGAGGFTSSWSMAISSASASAAVGPSSVALMMDAARERVDGVRELRLLDCEYREAEVLRELVRLELDVLRMPLLEE
jgi:hypothetical protein